MQIFLDDAVLVGNSAGGWIAAEVACRRLRASEASCSSTRSGSIRPTPPEASPTPSPQVQRARPGSHSTTRAVRSVHRHADLPSNQQALMVYAGEPYMHDPTLRARLASVAVPTLVVWGESDGVVEPAYGRQFADLIPGARFDLVAEAGHFPQVEQLSGVVQAIRSLD